MSDLFKIFKLENYNDVQDENIFVKDFVFTVLNEPTNNEDNNNDASVDIKLFEQKAFCSNKDKASKTVDVQCNIDLQEKFIVLFEKIRKFKSFLNIYEKKIFDFILNISFSQDIFDSQNNTFKHQNVLFNNQVFYNQIETIYKIFASLRGKNIPFFVFANFFFQMITTCLVNNQKYQISSTNKKIKKMEISDKIFHYKNEFVLKLAQLTSTNININSENCENTMNNINLIFNF